MSLIVLYFLHGTSVLSFYIDVILTLSIGSGNCSLPDGTKPLAEHFLTMGSTERKFTGNAQDIYL